MICLFAQIAFAQEPTDSIDRDYAEELPRIAPLEPTEALKTFEVHPDFEIRLAAAEPLVRDPIAMAFDEFGRMYVVEMRGYSEQRDEMLSTIRLLEDADGDGVFDTSDVYLDGLAWPTAIACYDGGVFIGMPPDIFYCKDTNGDKKADFRETVYTGFGTANVQGLLNSFTWGLDNRIHGAGSSTGGNVQRVDVPGTPTVSISGRDFAFDPRSREIVATSGGAQHGLSFDDWGRKFLCHNSDHCQLVMFEDRYIARNPYFAAPSPRISIAADGPAADVYRISPVEPWRVLRTRLRVKGLVPGPIEGGGTAAGYFTSATGITVYRGDAWPASYRGNAIIGDVGSNLIHRKIVEENGLELIARRADSNTEFVRSTDIWFRPVQFCNGPDGTLYVADMYREVIEHPDSLPPLIKKHLDLTSGRDQGRIYRIVPKGFKERAIPRLGDMRTKELAPLLAHDNAWHAETASRLIYQRQDKTVVARLEDMARTSESPTGRMRTLYALEGLDALTTEIVLATLADREPRVREHAVIMAEQFADDTAAIQNALAEMIDDPDLRVRYQLAFNLGESKGTQRNEALTTLAKRDGGDRWFRTAILSSLSDGATNVFARLLDDAAYRSSPEASDMLYAAARNAGAVGTPDQLEGVLARLDTLPETENALAQNGIRAILHGMKAAGKGAEVHAMLARSPRAAAQLAAMLDEARVAAADASLEDKLRTDAIATLGFARYANAKPVLEALLTSMESGDVQAAALQVLRRYQEEEVAAILLGRWPTFSPRLRAIALEALFASPARIQALLNAIDNGAFSPKDLDSTRIRALQSHEDASIRERAETIFASAAIGARETIVEDYQAALSLKGDTARGKAIFIEQCSPCHRLQDQGHNVGPDLVTVAQAGPEKILVNVLDPNREINPQYVNYIVQANVWETHTGIIASETATSITLKRANDETETILRVTIDNIQTENLSIMPEGFEEHIDKQGMADLIAYIQEAAQP